MYKYLIPLLVTFLMACQSSSLYSTYNKDILQDAAFPGFEQYPIESTEEIFALADDAKQFAREAIKGVRRPNEQIEALVKAIFVRSDFNLLYRADANTGAQETFANRAANCLSLSIMTYALATELDFAVRFQHIEIPEYWTRREGQSFLNSHINLQILPKADRDIIEVKRKGYEVDFDVQMTKKHDKKSLLTIAQVKSFFYNNKGSDALLNKNYLLAYAYYRAAYLEDPKQAHISANLGYLYRLNEHYTYAEYAYLQALKIDKDNLTAWQNLAYLYKYTDQPDKAAQILVRLEHKRASNPFYHLSLGDAAFERDDWQQALSYYRRALSLDKNLHEVFFGLGKTYYELGEMTRSAHFLKLAKKKARSKQEQQIYAGKIEFLRKHHLLTTS
ncbi:tetratricopeptide repeat protein [Paraglaciecola hydrolytica]|uniref:Uncharacterized protein n=1 Tax=Paraglaciecola hydrolytica TaxID=1799789 RepID=A0A136A208_9ALTE|nr:tetratricopeptide repeat protein [Paraglaciecola hydrolytica]KXI29265.1 hypothetical protein AX660_14060 [Paraglaciecola hydrolytica]